MADLLSQISEIKSVIETAQKQLSGLLSVQTNKAEYVSKVSQLEAAANPNNEFSEPTTPFASKYPYNNAKATESGHLMEFDDTPGAERVSIAHRTGTYYEIGPDGSMVEKIVNDNYQIIMKDDYIHIMGKATVSVQGDCKVYVQGNAQLQVDGNVNWKVGGNMNLSVGGAFTASAENFNFVGPINQVGDFTSTGNILNQGNISSDKSIQAGLDFVGHNNLDISGFAHTSGNISCDGDVVASGISLKSHTHSDPQGGSVGPPQ